MGHLLIAHASDDSVVIRFKEEISPAVAGEVRHARLAIEALGMPWVTDMVSSYNELLVIYDNNAVGPSEALDSIGKALASTASEIRSKAMVTEIPVCYGGEFGPDLRFVAEHTGLSSDEVISIHSGRDYLIYMIGFTIGFPYLGGMDVRLVTPRLQSPRQIVPKGSVGIAGKQTGIYSLDTPGGWQIIGRSPASLVNIDRTPPAVLSAGDFVRFTPVTEDEYHRLAEMGKVGKLRLKTRPFVEVPE